MLAARVCALLLCTSMLAARVRVLLLCTSV